jgi:hypothetical protein
LIAVQTITVDAPDGPIDALLDMPRAMVHGQAW